MRAEAQWLAEQAETTLRTAERHAGMPHRTACGQTEMAGKALKAVEFALAAIVTGRRPRAWKDPAALAAEAGAVSTGMPALDPGALARRQPQHRTAYPGYRYPRHQRPPRRWSWRGRSCRGRAGARGRGLDATNADLTPQNQNPGPSEGASTLLGAVENPAETWVAAAAQ